MIDAIVNIIEIAILSSIGILALAGCFLFALWIWALVTRRIL